jgi:hypothetical protein
MSTFKTTIERNIRGVDCEFLVTIRYTAHPFRRGYREPGGQQIEPDEPAHIEIESVTEDGTGVEIELTTAQEDEIEQRIAEELAAADEFAREEHYDRLREQRLEGGIQ